MAGWDSPPIRRLIIRRGPLEEKTTFPPVSAGMIRVAAATDDGRCFPPRHFGDARGYDLYDIGENAIRPVGRLMNSSGEEKIHADPQKAQGVAGPLRKAGVQAAVSSVFGPNLKRVKKRFVCLVVRRGVTPEAAQIQPALREIQRRLEEVSAEWERGEKRSVLQIR